MNGGTKGGQGGTIVTVDNAADFIYYVQGTKQTPYIIYVSGPIDLGGSSIRVRGHKTVIGLPGSRLTGNLKCYRSEESNNIFQLLRMDNLAGAGDGDCISIDNATNIWIDHCTFTDAGDGAVDIKNGADYVTVSWCKFQYTVNNGHSYVNLVGHSDTNGSADMGHLRVTFHHNWYSTLCHERMPSVRFGQAHVYNTYFNSPGNRYCIRTRLYAQCLVENNYFKDVQNPWERYVTSAGGDPGLLHASGNLFNNVTWYVGYDSSSVLIDGTETVFTPPYAYLLDPAEKIPALVQWGAGADGRDGCPPHWVFGTYGDFDYSGLVDMADYSQFSSYWLATTGIEDADYNENGLVDGEELALFVEHWMKLPTDETPPEKPANLWAQGNDGLVTLSWADHAEEDLAGYAIYRSTTSGSGYVKLNADPLTVSEYVDNSVINGTLYYYIVRAIDVGGNVSDDSVEACALPEAACNIVIQENATGYCGVNGKVDVSGEHSGYTGIGYLDTTNAVGSGIDWGIYVRSAGTYTFLWRFANGSTDRPARLLVNAVEMAASINFPATGAWENWTTATVHITLPAGNAAIRLEATTSGGCANIDYFKVSGEGPEAGVCP
jgi:pectate lyase